VLALFDADGQEASGHAFHLGMKLSVGEPVAGGGMDEGFALGEAIGLQIQDVADGEAGINAVNHCGTS
jgi:hypothetical protein